MMCRRISIFVALMVLAQGALAQSPIPVETPGVPADSSICYRAPVTPVIDGDLSDWVADPETEWIGAAFKFIGTAADVIDGRHEYWDGPADMSSMWSTMWDDDYLYFAAAITDDYLNKSEPPNIGNLAQDCTIFYLDINRDLSFDMALVMGIGIDANEPNQLYLMSKDIDCIDTTGRVLYPGHLAAHVMDERLGPAGRFVELAIPWEQLQNCGMAVPEVGSFFGLNPAQEESYNNAQTDGGGFVSWLGDTESHAIYFAEPLFDDVIAYGPNPMDMGVDVARETEILLWRAGKYAATHDIYFGTDFDAVNDATKASSEFQTSQQADGVIGSFDLETLFPSGMMAIGKTYYWRVDEINNAEPNSPWKGDVWSFTVADFLVVDDMESYNDVDKPIYDYWHDGYYDDDNGSVAGHDEPDFDAGEHYAERDIVRDGLQSLPFFYNTDGTKFSEIWYDLEGEECNLTRNGIADLSLWFKGFPLSQGSMVEAPAGIFTVRGAGKDIWADADEFHFVYKEITGGAATIIAKVESLENDPTDPNTDPFAKAGVMIRNTLKPGSVYGSMLLSKEEGIRNQYRLTTGGITERVFDPNLVAPYWVKVDRAKAGITRFSLSTDGITWTDKTSEYGSATSFSLKVLSMQDPIYVGLAVTSHLEKVPTEAVFSNVTITGTGSDGPWQNGDIGIYGNKAERLYVAVDDAIVYHDDPNATLIEPWTQWRIPLQDFADQGANLTDANNLFIGIGTPSDTLRSGSEGQIFIDDMRLYLP